MESAQRDNTAAEINRLRRKVEALEETVARLVRERAADAIVAEAPEYLPPQCFAPIPAKRLWEASQAGRVRFEIVGGGQVKGRRNYHTEDVRRCWPDVWRDTPAANPKFRQIPVNSVVVCTTTSTEE